MNETSSSKAFGNRKLCFQILEVLKNILKVSSRIKYELSCLMLAMSLLLTSCEPAYGSIRGRVMDENNNPLPSALVRIKATRLETISAEDGSFSLEESPSDGN